MTVLVGHFLLFAVVIVAALALPLLAGRLIRPHNPTPDKVAVYECGEPTIGTSQVQFDLRFYVVALLFIVFDIEVAFFFPWAVVFGTAVQLSDERLPALSAQAIANPALADPAVASRLSLSESLLSVPPGTLPPAEAISAEAARAFAWTGFADVLVFFGVLLVGFAYVWKRGDLDWVRAVSERVRRTAPPQRSPATVSATREPQVPVRS